MMYYTNDLLADFARHDAEQQKELDKLPRCDYCDEPIQDDFYFSINYEVICESCLDRFFRKDVADYVGE